MRAFVLRSREVVDRLQEYLSGAWALAATAGAPLEVLVVEHKARRSSHQNKFYWARLQQVASLAWVNGQQYSAEAWHEHVKRKFIGYQELPGGGMIGLSTTTLSVEEFSEYVTKVEAYAASELGVVFDA